MSMRIGLDLFDEKIFVEMGSGGGLKTTVNMSAKVARAFGAQLIANAEALDIAMEEGNLGNDNDNVS